MPKSPSCATKPSSAAPARTETQRWLPHQGFRGTPGAPWGPEKAMDHEGHLGIPRRLWEPPWAGAPQKVQRPGPGDPGT